MHINWFNIPHSDSRDQSYLHCLERLLEKDISNVIFKHHFCAFIASQPKGKRVDFVPKLSQYKTIHCAGRLYNNTGGVLPGRGDQKPKIDFLKNFKFNISFENCSSSGYVTEKIIQPMFTNTIPIYWGANDVHLDFNKKAFINSGDFSSDEELIHYIQKVDQDEYEYMKVLSEPWFIDNKVPQNVQPKAILNFIREEVLK